MRDKQDTREKSRKPTTFKLLTIFAEALSIFLYFSVCFFIYVFPHRSFVDGPVVAADEFSEQSADDIRRHWITLLLNVLLHRVGDRIHASSVNLSSTNECSDEYGQSLSAANVKCNFTARPVTAKMIFCVSDLMVTIIRQLNYCSTKRTIAFLIYFLYK